MKNPLKTFVRKRKKKASKLHHYPKLLEELFQRDEEINLIKREKDLAVEELANMKAERDDAKQKLSDYRKVVIKALEHCRKVKRGIDILEAGIEKNASANEALTEWQKAYANPLYKRTLTAEANQRHLIGFAFGEAINIAIKAIPRAKKIPFVYYDFINKRLSYTPAILDFFGIDEEKIGEKLTLTKLLSYVDRKYLKSNYAQNKIGIIDALKIGKPLLHYDAMTSGESPRRLYLTTYPVFCNEQAVGVSIFLNDPDSLLRRVRGTRKFEKKIEEIIKEGVEIFSGLMPPRTKPILGY